jgi:NAD(P)-dependent dehydrogenase (short-subunit alcohol dehydrogenase family)
MAIYPELAGKVAIVTGGGVGIGAAVVRRLVENGADVAVVGRRDQQAIETVAAEAREQGVRAVPILADVSRPERVEHLFAEVEAELGPVDILVNNAGGTQAAPIEMLTPEVWDETMAANLTSCYLCTRRALPGMLARRWGRIVNVASAAGRMPSYPLSSAYAAAKAGMIGFTKHVALELGDSGVTINCTAPGLTASPRVLGMLGTSSAAGIASATCRSAASRSRRSRRR